MVFHKVQRETSSKRTWWSAQVLVVLMAPRQSTEAYFLPFSLEDIHWFCKLLIFVQRMNWMNGVGVWDTDVWSSMRHAKNMPPITMVHTIDDGWYVWKNV